MPSEASLPQTPGANESIGIFPEKRLLDEQEVEHKPKQGCCNKDIKSLSIERKQHSSPAKTKRSDLLNMVALDLEQIESVGLDFDQCSSKGYGGGGCGS